LRIKSLQIAGFKSFVDKTVFSFKPGITSIVGPNGCGKSNVVDAMRWAMGEQSPRHLRGKRMEDIIFAGAEARAPVGMAEVSLVFDNSAGRAPAAYGGFEDIQITRRLYRTGESEYLINKVPCRLRDVLDFFRDTGIGTKGYTIVEQGQIAAIVSSKPEERRQLIEEAAGISKYKARRAESERKLASTESNLLRVNDVLAEIRRQIGSLERQAKKAERFKRLREEARTLDLSLAADERRDHQKAIEGANRRLAELRDEVTGGETRLAELDAELEQKRLAATECEQVVGQGSEVLHGLRSEIKQLESRIEFETREIESLREANTARSEELVRLRQSLAASEEEAGTIERQLAEVEATLRGEAESKAAAEAEARSAGDALRALHDERETDNGALVDVLTRTARFEDRSAALADRRDEIDQRLRSADQALELQSQEAVQIDRQRAALEDGLRNLLAERDRLHSALREALERDEVAIEAAREVGERLQALRDMREARRARLASLREVLERHEDVGTGTRHLLEGGGAAREQHGLRALVREVIEVDPAVEPAVEAVLAERAEAIVVKRPENALSALRALREGKAGRGLFLVPRDAPAEGFVPLGESLLARVRPRRGFEGVAAALLSGVNLIGDLAEAVRVYGVDRLPCTFVTAEGDVLAGTGALARVREVRDLTAEVERLDAEVSGLESQHAEAERACAQARDDLENLRNRNHTAALAVANHEKDLERTRERHKAVGEAREGRSAERSELMRESEAIASELRRLAASLDAAQVERGERQRGLDALLLRIGSATRELSRYEAIVTERRVSHQNRVEKCDQLRASLARTRQGAQETQEWIGRRQAEIEAAEARRVALDASTQDAERNLTLRLRDEEGARRNYDDKRDAYERENAAVRTLESRVRELRTEVASQREAAQAAELTARETELRLQHLEEAILEKWNVDIASWVPAAPLPAVEEEAEAAEEAAPGEVEAVAQEAPSAPLDAAEQLERERAAERGRNLLELPREERSRRLAETRRKLEAMGDVNLGAIEEHEELGERFRFLTEQKTDLESTVASLREAIQRINRTSRRRFRETFEAVNARFIEIFPRLFRGGKANLSLTEGDDDVLEAGIDIVAQPPGKRLQNVNLLSGGEKTLTAIALLMSLFQVRTSPFFLLD
jgi:chromosome segregation protein